MISKRQTDPLHALIKALEKAEKRHFKLYINRNSSNEDLKIVQLFDALDKQPEYDEEKLLKKLPTIQKAQLSNLKAHLQRQVLASLRLLKSNDSIDLQLNEYIDYAHVLYKKGLYAHSLRWIERAKETARGHQKFTFLAQVLALEKRIESLYLTRGLQHRAEVLAEESMEITQHIYIVERLSSLALRLYSWYLDHGHVHDPVSDKAVKALMDAYLPPDAASYEGFYHRLYYYQSLTWYAYIRQDYLRFYRNTQKWIQLFETQPLMKRAETGHYLKGLHNALNAQYNLRSLRRHDETLAVLEEFAATDRVQKNDSFRVQALMHISLGKINRYAMTGDFEGGVVYRTEVEKALKEAELFIDSHRLLVFQYKFAAMHFGAGQFGEAVDCLQGIINEDVGVRYDLQCYARLMHLLAHYELGNLELLSYLSRSVYRYITKMKNLTELEVEILRFLRHSFDYSPRRLTDELRRFLGTVKKFENDRYEIRVFVHLDIVSWVESKVTGKSMTEIVKSKVNAKSLSAVDKPKSKK